MVRNEWSFQIQRFSFCVFDRILEQYVIKMPYARFLVSIKPHIRKCENLQKKFLGPRREAKRLKKRLITNFSDDIEGRPAKVIAFYFLLLLASRERLCFVMGVESCNFFSWREATTCIMLAYVVDILNLNLFLGWTRFRARYLLSFFLFGKWSVITFKMLQHQERKKCDSLCIAVFSSFVFNVSTDSFT